jgi:ADP-heptose:LPS heptosyltransferase
MSKALIHHDGALGDVILSAPVFKIIRATYPDDLIQFIGRPQAIGFLKLAAMVDETFSSDSHIFADLYAETLTLNPLLTDLLASCGKAYVFTANPESILVEQLKKRIPNTAIILTKPSRNQRVHVTTFQLNQLPSSYVAVPHLKDIFRKPEPIINNDWGKGKTTVVVHPGSGGRKKCWHPIKYLNLMKQVRRRFDVFFAVLSGPAEETFIRAFEQSCSDLGLTEFIRFFHNQPLGHISSILRDCAIYIGNDSGVTHFASLFAPHIIAIFGPTDPCQWAPQGDHVRVIESFFPCSPCSETLYRNCRTWRCIDSIPIGKALDEFMRLLT